MNREFWLIGEEIYGCKQDFGILRPHAEQIHVREVNPKVDLAVEGLVKALDEAHLMACDETEIDKRCFICDALEAFKKAKQ